jgi:hypothetical protein
VLRASAMQTIVAFIKAPDDLYRCAMQIKSKREEALEQRCHFALGDALPLLTVSLDCRAFMFGRRH